METCQGKLVKENLLVWKGLYSPKFGLKASLSVGRIHPVDSLTVIRLSECEKKITNNFKMTTTIYRALNYIFRQTHNALFTNSFETITPYVPTKDWL